MADGMVVRQWTQWVQWESKTPSKKKKKTKKQRRSQLAACLHGDSDTSPGRELLTQDKVLSC